MNQSPIQILFETCKEHFNKNAVHTLEQFRAQCKKDRIMGEVVESICYAMERYAAPFVERNYVLQDQINILNHALAELKKDHVIV